MQKTLSLVHVSRAPKQPAPAPPLLVLLHGYGSNEHDLLGLAPYLDGRLLVVSARAPLSLMPSAFAWFPLGFSQSGADVNPDDVVAARAQVIAFVEEATAAYGADPARVYVLGFSQGAMMAAAATLERPALAAGVALLSGSVAPEMLPSGDTTALIGKPFLVQHGIGDTVLPIEHGRRSKELLSRLPVALDYREYPMGHEVGMASLTDLDVWLRARLGE